MDWTTPYRHPVVAAAQSTKSGQHVCGDMLFENRQPDGATFMVLDGIGSGVKANVAAQFYSARLSELLKRGFSTREAAGNLLDTLHRARTEDVLFSAFTLLRVLPDGSAHSVSYEMPPPIYIEKGTAAPARQRFFTVSGEVVGEADFMLRAGTGVLIVSDGVTQAGMGRGLPYGLTDKGACDFASSRLYHGSAPEQLPGLLVAEAEKLCGGDCKDDATAAFYSVRAGNTVHILTGPPANSADDWRFVSQFIGSHGSKAVCGSTTAEIFSRISGAPLRISESANPFEPPESFIDGADMVTEGALTLNQLYNIMDEPTARLDPASPVSRLRLLLDGADRVRFCVGMAENLGHSGIIFRQLNVLPRRTIVPLLAEKLRGKGKLVIIENF
ncbi:MAG: SpoIIE family protein phosphatase [Elusimicrobia bacterium]|nr:SpoIIE family protein phosphatase [Elusimicrobiota bacterium]